ncbi:MAG: LamG-like jellyroll fold domain-containing protein [Rhodoglobus sp.]
MLAATLAFAGVGGAAWAYWLANSTAGSSGASAATAVNGGSTPTANVVGTTVTVTWAASALANGQPVTGYLVKRYEATTLVSQTMLASCAGTVAATSCVESSVPAGSWKYAITPVFATNWQGAESAKSATVVVGNTAPIAVANAYSVAENATLTVASPGVLGNDTDVNSDPLTAILVTGVAHGVLTLNSNGAISYVPEADYNGSDSFTYKANDGTLDSNTVTVSLTVTAVNSAPVNRVPATQHTPRNTNKVLSIANRNEISISDVDAGGATVQVQLTATSGVVTLPVLTGLTFTAGDGTSDATMTFTGTIANINLRLDGLTFIPTNNFTGNAALQIVTNDLGNTGSGGAQTDSDTITIVVNSLGIFDAASDVSTLLDPLLGGSSAYAAGSYTVAGGGSDIWNNSDHFQFLETILTGDGRLTARVVSQSQAPLLPTAAAKAGVMFRKDLTAGSIHGMVDVMQANGSEFHWRLTANGLSAATTGTAGIAAPYWVRITRVGDVVTGERSPDGVTWTQQGATQTITMGSTIYAGLAVSAVNNTQLNTAVFDNVAISTPPTAVADSYSTNEDTTLTVPVSGVLRNDTDPENDALTAVLVSGTTGLTLNANGSFTYVPSADFAGAASFTYKAFDGAFNSNTVTVTITVKPANEVPSFTKGANQSVPNVAAQSVSGWATAISQGVGESGQLLTFIVTNDNNALFGVQPQVSPTGTLTYTPTPGTSGVATVSVRLLDNGGTANGGVDTSAIQTFTITTAPDTSGPTGGSVDATGLVGTGSRYSTSTTLSVALLKGSDPSGVAASGAQLLRATATLTGGVCGTYGGYSLVTGGADPSSPKSDIVTDQACYSYHYLVADNLGNPTTYASGDVKVDTTAATAPTLTFSGFTNTYWGGSGTTAYYRSAASAGSLVVTAVATDAASGIASYAYPGLGTNWASTPGALGVTTYSWTGAPAAPGTKNATATNNAGAVSANAPFTLTDDITAPSAGTVNYASGSSGGAAVSVSFTTGTDAGSGIGTRLLQRATAPLSGTVCGAYGAFATISAGTNPVSPVLDTVPNDGCYKYQYVVSDNVGNLQTATNANVVHTPYSAYWAFDAGSGTSAVDSSVNANDGTLQAAAGWTAGKIGAGALNLNGTATSYVDVPYPVIDSSQSYTVSAWVKLNNLTGFQSFASIDGSSISPFYLQLVGGVFGFGQRSSDSTVSTFVGVTGTAPTVGVWYHVAGVYNKTAGAGTIELFVNGVSQGTTAAGTTWTAAGHTLVGHAKWNGAAVDFVNGAIDEVRFYDRALTATEIGVLARSYSDSVGRTTGLLSYWRLGEASAASPMDDIATANNDGAYFNAPTVGVTGALPGDVNNAVQFDGVNDYATAARQISGDFSIEFWFKSTQNFSNDFGQPHCTFWWQGASLVDADSGGPANDFGISLCAGQIIAGVGSPDVNIVTAGTYNNGAWHHVVFTRTQATGALTLYVDGASVGSATGNVNALTSTTTINFGRSTSAVNYFAGTLDEIAFYTTALPLVTVQTHYTSAQ